MKRIWAPWRIKYILDKTHKKCIFCQDADKKDEKKYLILYQNKYTLVMLNKFPYTCGHLLVAPKRHTADLSDLSKNELLNLFLTLRKSIKLLNNLMKPHGFNVGMNLGKVAGAGIHQHLHIHIIPRWKGDTNFMPLITDSIVISESLSATYDRLYPDFKNLNRNSAC